MNKTPKTIRIILTDGSPQGIKIAEVGNRIGKAIVIPRTKLKDAAARVELQSVGVYFLLGEQAEGLPKVYIGEAENIWNRVKQHSNDEKKDFWEVAVAFVAKDDSITKAHAKYLESYMYSVAQKVKRSDLQNNSSPATANLPEIDQVDAMEFFENIKLLLSTLGYPIFEDATDDVDGGMYYCTGPDAEGKGLYTDEGFVVLKGSKTRKDIAPASITSVGARVSKLLEQGVLSEFNESQYIFEQDFVFGSPSTAAMVVLGRHANGWNEWKDESGSSLHKNERQESL